MLHVGLDLSRRRVDVCLISDQGELVGRFPAPADRDGLYGLTRRVAAFDEPVRGVVESMNGARFVHDELGSHGWEVLIADAQRVKGLAPLACKTDKVDARVLAELSVPRPGAGDLAARPAAARRAGAVPVPPASGQASLEPEEPDPFDANRGRIQVPDV
jgi:transposase